MNRSLDYRSDFYSLGATFYEMLTGLPPFTATDPMELVHCHLAKTPVPAHTHQPNVPPILSQLFDKLMAKTAEERYQSAFGLIADLENCQQQWLANQQCNHFVLGQQDVSEHFQIPQKLYGRETEIAQLLSAFASVSYGSAEILLVAGYSGVGKTALVYEVHKPITESRGYFISGKFDQFQRDIPYASLIAAFQELMRQLLTESAAQIARWKSLLEHALGVNAQVIIEVIPEVAWIMGPQTAVPELPPNQAQNRFNLVFQQFIRTFASAEHPLVLFLDDLQWSDLPSLQLIQSFMTAPDTRYLLVIGAYRDNEVSPTHPLMLMLEEISKAATQMAKSAPTTLTLLPLNEAHTLQLLAETLHSGPNPALHQPEGEPNELSELAKLCLAKTQGNPFFLSQFLHALVEARQIAFNHTTRRWQWDMAELQQTAITNNVVELMAEKIQSLPTDTQALLQLAACIGNQFDLTTLALAGEQSAMASAQALWPSIQAHLLVPLDQTYRYLTLDTATTANCHFKFVHDRVQQAAYSLIAEKSKAAMHLRIGRLLLAHFALTANNQREERIFDLVYQWNRGRDFITLPSEKEELARLNLLAGKKARSSAAYKPALGYFQTGLTLIGPEGWAKQYELSLSLSLAATEAAYLAGDFEEMHHWVKMVLQHGKTLLDKVKVYEIQIQASIAQNQALAAIQIALPVLKQLGVNLPAKPNKLHILRGLLETKWALAGKPVEDLIQLPHMTAAVPLAAMQILSSISAAAYFVQPDLLPLITFKQVLLTVRYGNTALSAFAYAVYGLILCGSLGDIALGYRFGSLAVSTLAHLSANAIKAKTMFVVESMTRHWRAPFQQRLQPLLEAWQSGMETGDFEYAAYAAHDYCIFLFFTGNELPLLHEEITKYSGVMAQNKQEQSLGWQKIFDQVVLNLLGFCDDPCRLCGTSFNEDAIPITAYDRTTTLRISSYKMILCYMFGQYSQALEQAVITEQHLDAIVGSPVGAVCHFYMALVRLAVVAQTPKVERAALLKKVAAIQKKLKKWAHHAPANHLHKWHLVEAERTRVIGADLAAMEHYEQAIALARNHDFPHEVALANELAGRFYLARKQEKVAMAYLQDAHYGYQQWGANAKVSQMRAQYAFLLSKAIKQTSVDDTSTTVLQSDTLDLSTVMKATQAISGEIVLEHLLEKLMRILIESAGAQHGLLLLETNGEWRIEAEGNVNEEKVSVLQSRPLLPAGNAVPDAPISLIQYTALTKEPMVLGNAALQGRFTSDPYISQHRSKSVLCAPILQQGKLAGILYLENNLIEAAFTLERLEILKILSSQAAISIENARVYENLEAKVTQRTATLQTTLSDLVATQTQLLQSNDALNAANAGLLLSVETLRQLGDIGREITANLDADIVFQSLYLHVGSLLNAQVMTIYRMNSAATMLDAVFVRNADQVLPLPSVALNSPTSNAARAVRERQELLLHYERTDDPSSISGTRRMRTALFAPLIVDERVLGVMKIQSERQNAYGERECLIFRTLSAYGAIALANASVITELTKLQGQLVQQEKMASLGGLVAGIAHEINTPLGTTLVAISGVDEALQTLQNAVASERLSKAILETCTKEGLEYTALALKTANRAAELIALFKTISVNTKSDLQEEVELATYLQEVAMLVRRPLEQKGCKLVLTAPAGLRIRIVPDALTETLSRVLVNVLNHAFIDGRTGTLRLSAQASAADDGDEVVITVSDDGHGIAPEDLPRVFDPFFTTQSGVRGHVGLGLHVAYNHVTERLKGKIQITSTLGEGSCVAIRLKQIEAKR